MAGDAAVLKSVNSFVDILGIDRPERQHAIGRLMLVSGEVENWLRQAIFYLADQGVKDRPYRKAGAWEAMLWSSA